MTIKWTMIELARHFGWLLLLAGLVMPAMQVVDAMTCEPATATVTRVLQRCSVETCTFGWCSSKTVDCAAAAAEEVLGSTVVRTTKIELTFQTAAGIRAKARPSLSKLERRSAHVGDRIDIIYRRNAPSYVSAPFQQRQVVVGLAISAAGLLILLIARGRTGRSAAESHPRGVSGERRHAQAAKSWPLRNPAQPTRQNSVQRNHGWFS